MYLAFYGILAVLSVLEAAFASQLWPLMAISLFIFFVVKLFKSSPKPSLAMFAMTLTKILILISLIAISQGIWITELSTRVDGPVYSIYFCLISCLFLQTSCFTAKWLAFLTVDSKYDTVISGVSFINFFGVIIIMSTVLIYLITIGWSNGFPLISKIDRFAYRAESSWLFNVIITSKTILSCSAGLIRFNYVKDKSLKILIDILFVLFCAILILFGDKFLSLIVLIGFYALPKVLRSGAKDLTVARPLLIGLSLVLPVALTITIFVYSDYGSLDWATTMDRLFGRVTGQGQLWYISMKTGNSIFGVERKAITDLIGALGVSGGANALDRGIGIFYLVNRFAPTNTYTSIQDAAGYVQFTGGFEAYTLLIGGHAFMLFSVCISGFIAGLACFYTINSVKNRSVMGTVASTFFYMAVYTMTNQGAIWLVFSIRAMIYIGILVFLDVIFRYIVASRRVRIARTEPI